MRDMAKVIAAHQKVSMGMSSGTPDTCRCGEKTYPDKTEQEISLRRDVSFARHISEKLGEAGYIKPKVLGYIVVDREGGIILAHPTLNRRTAEMEAAIRTEECRQAGIDWNYRVAHIVEVDQ